MWLEHQNLALNDTTASLFVMYAAPSIQTAHQYVKTFHAMFRQMNLDASFLTMTGKGLRQDGALTPMSGAKPISPDQLRHLLTQLASSRKIPTRGSKASSNPLEVAVRFCYKRGEVCEFPAERPTLRTDAMIIVDWFDPTKASHQNPFRESRFTVITGRWTKYLNQHLPKQGFITTTTTPQMEYQLKKYPPGAGITCHSFKKAALDTLLTYVEAGKLQAKFLVRLAKHKAPQQEDLPETTQRYLGNLPDLAKFLGTQHATQFL